MKKLIFDFNDWENKKVVMHCKTNEEATMWCDFMKQHGKIWTYDKIDKGNKWKVFRENTCYSFNENSFGEKPWYVEWGYDVIEFEDFYIDDSFIKDMLETGMVVELRNGEKYMIMKEYNRIINSVNSHFLMNFDVQLFNNIDHAFDIIKVRKPDKKQSSILSESYWGMIPLIWSRVEEKEIQKTEQDKTIIGYLKLCGYKYIAQDENGDQQAFIRLPIKTDCEWVTETFEQYFKLNQKLSFLSWEDKYPYEIK